MANFMQTDEVSARYRAAAIDVASRHLLITNFKGTEQEPDLSEPPNCGGFGRIRHFRRSTSDSWPANPLPIDPACKALGLAPTNLLRAQIFQNAVCNWRCWYCYVPYQLLSGSRTRSDWKSASTLVDLYLDQPDPPRIIDLSGGQPDLTPEWVPWMMEELRHRRLDKEVYLWSDDNLSNDYFWRFLSDSDRELVATYPNYGRTCCFKGFDDISFSFNTSAPPELFAQQFALFRRILALGVDAYAYATFTTPKSHDIGDSMKRFLDRLQELDVNLPLRTIPLEIQPFTPVEPRLNAPRRDALENQWTAIEGWHRELEDRFSATLRSTNIADIPLMSR